MQEVGHDEGIRNNTLRVTSVFGKCPKSASFSV